MNLSENVKLNMETVSVENDLFEALKSLSDFDANWNGKNGVVSQEASENGFNNNQEYCIDRLKMRMITGDFEESHEIVEAFCDEWFADVEHQVMCHYNEDKNIDFIVVAFVK